MNMHNFAYFVMNIFGKKSLHWI